MKDSESPLIFQAPATEGLNVGVGELVAGGPESSIVTGLVPFTIVRGGRPSSRVGVSGVGGAVPVAGVVTVVGVVAGAGVVVVRGAAAVPVPGASRPRPRADEAQAKARQVLYPALNCPGNRLWRT